MMISKKAGWGTVKCSSIQPDLDYNSLSKISNIKDMRTATDNKNNFVKDFDQICKNSILPLPAFVDSEDDTSSESYVPHSDWQGPSGTTWIGKGYNE